MVHLESHRDQKEFDATLALKAQPFTTKALITLLIRTPMMTVKVLTGIYWHALKLWIKGAPFYSHPKYRQHEADKNNKENSQC